MMPYVRKGIEEGAQVPAHRYLWALAELNKLRLVIRRFFMDYDLLVLPSTSVTAFPVDHRPEIVAGEKIEPMWGWYATLFPFNLSGNPAASIPCGFTCDGLPIGMQIVGRKLDEATVLRASAAFEEAKPWANVRPSISKL